MKAFANKMVRGQLEQSIISTIRASNPNYDQYMTQYKFPSYAKIVVYSNSLLVKPFLSL